MSNLSTMQPFEKFPELAKIIEWFANNVSVPGTEWNKLIHEINRALSASTPSSAEVYRKALEKIAKKMKVSEHDGTSMFYELVKECKERVLIAREALSHSSQPEQVKGEEQDAAIGLEIALIRILDDIKGHGLEEQFGLEEDDYLTAAIKNYHNNKHS